MSSATLTPEFGTLPEAAAYLRGYEFGTLPEAAAYLRGYESRARANE